MVLPPSERTTVSAGGRSNEYDGGTIGRANRGEPTVIKYCGPTGKLVSCAEATPTSANNKKGKPQIRIEPPSVKPLTGLIMERTLSLLQGQLRPWTRVYAGGSE